MRTTKRQTLRAGLNESKAKASTVPIAARGLTASSPRSWTREIILNAALKLYGRDGYSAVTMRALAQEIGCSAASIYTYFLDKNEIFSTLHGDGLRLYAEASTGVMSQDPVNALRKFFLGYYEFSKTHPEYFTLLWVDRAIPRFAPTPDLRRAVEAAHAHARRCLDERVFPPGLTPAQITRVLWSAVHGPAVLGQLPDGTPGSEADTLAAAVLDLTLAGLETGALLDRIAHQRNCE